MPNDRAEPGVTAELAVAAVYTREVRVGIDRIWENVLDWEHLPALHEIYFDAAVLRWGWRVELTKTLGNLDVAGGARPAADRGRSALLFA